MEIIILTVVCTALTGMICSRVAAGQVQVQWKLPQVIHKREQTEGELCVLFKKKILFGKTRIYMQFTNQMTGESFRSSCTLKAHGGEETVKQFGMQFRYSGTIRCEIEKIRVYDWLGITFKTIRRDCAQGILVLPDPAEMDRQQEIVQMNPEEGEMLLASLHGYDYSEPFGIREYRVGDSLKSIHWKMTGRLGKLYVKEAGIPASQTMLVFAETIHVQQLMPEQCDRLASELLTCCSLMTERHLSYDVIWYEHAKRAFTTVHVDGIEDVRTVMYQFMKCRQIQGGVTGREQYEHLYPGQELIYIQAASHSAEMER